MKFVPGKILRERRLVQCPKSIDEERYGGGENLQTLGERKNEKRIERVREICMNITDQRIHTIVLSQLRAAERGWISHFHGYSWTTIRDVISEEKEQRERKIKKNSFNRVVVEAAKGQRW